MRKRLLADKQHCHEPLAVCDLMEPGVLAPITARREGLDQMLTRHQSGVRDLNGLGDWMVESAGLV